MTGMVNLFSCSREQMTADRYAEETQLRKADADIVAGRGRLHEQERLIRALRESGKATREAERLAALFRETLIEWERHRTLIIERLAYLKAMLNETAREA